VFHISGWGIEALYGGLSGDGTEFWATCDSVGCEFQMPGWQRKNLQQPS